MLALEIVALPVGPEQQHATLLTIGAEDGGSTERRYRLYRIRHPPRDGIVGRIDPDLDAVLGAQAADDHVELQRADDADDRLAAAGGEVEHLHQPFFLELLESFVELLVACVLQADA